MERSKHSPTRACMLSSSLFRPASELNRATPTMSHVKHEVGSLPAPATTHSHGSIHRTAPPTTQNTRPPPSRWPHTPFFSGLKKIRGLGSLHKVEARD